MLVISTSKAIHYFGKGKVFPIRRSSAYELWIVEGKTGTWNIRYDILKDKYECTCKNVRFTPCSHIKSVVMMRGEKAWKRKNSGTRLNE